jgi:hypothetical protein
MLSRGSRTDQHIPSTLVTVFERSTLFYGGKKLEIKINFKCVVVSVVGIVGVIGVVAGV